jgi:hypothetical protein
MSDLQVKTRTNGEITLQQDTIRKFKESLRGELILSDDAGTMMHAPSGMP